MGKNRSITVPSAGLAFQLPRHALSSSARRRPCSSNSCAAHWWWTTAAAGQLVVAVAGAVATWRATSGGDGLEVGRPGAEHAACVSVKEEEQLRAGKHWRWCCWDGAATGGSAVGKGSIGSSGGSRGGGQMGQMAARLDSDTLLAVTTPDALHGSSSSTGSLIPLDALDALPDESLTPCR